MNSNLLTIQERANNIMKAFNPDFQKGGEGSRGGHVIGHTKSGKPVYGEAATHSYKDFTSADHRDAADLHYNQYTRHTGFSKISDGPRDSAKMEHHIKLHREHYDLTDEGKKDKEDERKAEEARQRVNNSPQGKLLMKNKKKIFNGMMKLGEKYFGKHRSGFIHTDFEDTEFDVLDPDTIDFQGEDPETSSFVDDAFYLGGVFNEETGKVEDLPGYKEHEGEQMNKKFVRDFYKKNPKKHLISYDASLDNLAIIKKI